MQAWSKQELTIPHLGPWYILRYDSSRQDGTRIWPSILTVFFVKEKLFFICPTPLSLGLKGWTCRSSCRGKRGGGDDNRSNWTMHQEKKESIFNNKWAFFFSCYCFFDFFRFFFRMVHWLALCPIVSLAAVFSIVTQRSLRGRLKKSGLDLVRLSERAPYYAQSR